MRITTVILIASFLQVSAAGFAQKISLNKTRAPLNEILNEIRNQSGYDFFYNNESVKKANPVTINVKEVSLEQALAICFENQPLAYQIDDKVVMIRIENQVYTFPDNMRFANIDVKVQVLDEKGEPLPGATVTIKGTSRKLVTGAGGTVTITVLDEKAVLLVSYLGYATQEVTIKKGQVSLTVKLVTEESQMNNVVVTGIFNKPKDSYTGAEHTITAKELKQFQGRNLFVTLGNIDPTFYVVPNNSAGSDPNRIPDIQIRGARSLPNIDQLQDQTAAALNTPLIILDEFETTLQRMMDLDNNEIESITLLKDGAATALYGSRGANGVVVIKTKEPIAGKLRLSYRFGMNLSVPDLGSYNLLNSADKLELERLSGYYQSSTKTPEANLGLQQYYNQILGQVAKGVNTDWLSVPLRTQIDQIHNLKIEGGDPTFRYDLALQYNNQNGAMKESGRKAFNGTINLSYRYKSLTFRNNLVIGQTKEHDSPYGSFSDYAKLNPYWEPYDASGKLNRYFSPFNWDYWTITSKYAGKPYPNPMYDATLNTFTRRSYTSITNNFQLEFRPAESILLKAGVGVIGNNSDADDFKPAEHSAFAGYDDSNLFRKGTYAYGSGKSFSYTTTLSASYNKLFAEKHRVYVGLSADMNENKSRNYGFAAEGFPDESIDFLGMGLQYQQNGSPDGSESTRRRIGMLGNINYALKDRYLADFAYRLDGASQFGVNRRFAPFWSAGLGWNIHYESFIKDNLLFVDRLKLRGSYGSTGSTQFDAYQALGTYSYVLNDRYKNWLGVQQNALGNPDLEWQQTNKYNLGLELALFKSRVTLEADVYLEKTSNLLSSLELPYSNGFTSYNENIGQLETRGFELRATTMLIKNDARGISWSLTGNLVHNRDKIVKLSEAMKAANEKLALQTAGDVAYSPNKIIREGTSQNTIYVVRSLGIDPSTGKELYLNKEGEVTYMWNARDRVAAGLDQPKFRGNFSTAFYYKSFSVGASFGYRFGGQLYNQTLIDKIENADRLFNVDERVYLERWKQPGDKTFFRGLNETLPVYASSRFVQDERTLTLQNVNLSYDVRNQKFLSRLGLQSLSVVGNTGELFYVSSVRQERGLDYPFTRQFSLSIYAAF